ncbi:MAG: GNAT family N-acetyltransferase [Methanobacteriota archaeon]|nr:MAG: GNAT family N-acetyltransferase [Euryarchaeota archaeon]
MLTIKVIESGEEFKKLVKPEDALEVINSLVEERAYILVDEKQTIKDEVAWVESNAKAIDKGTVVFVGLFDGTKYTGGVEARRKKWRERHNVDFGIAIRKEYRGGGWGKKLLLTAIDGAKKKLNPHKMWIEYIDGNEIAKNFYEKCGFVEVARLKEYVYYEGQWKDRVIMELLE